MSVFSPLIACTSSSLVHLKLWVYKPALPYTLALKGEFNPECKDSNSHRETFWKNCNPYTSLSDPGPPSTSGDLRCVCWAVAALSAQPCSFEPPRAAVPRFPDLGDFLQIIAYFACCWKITGIFSSHRMAEFENLGICVSHIFCKRTRSWNAYQRWNQITQFCQWFRLMLVAMTSANLLILI